MQSTSWETLGWKKHKMESRFLGEIPITWYADDTTVMSESEEELKNLLMKAKEESEKAGLKLNIQKTKIMASGPITSWQIDGETVSDFILGGSKITAGGDCRHEIKRCLLLGRKVMTNLDSILKSRDITLPTKTHLVKAMFFSSGHVWMWEVNCEESRVLKNWCFWAVVLEKTLESPLDCKEIQPVHPEGNQSWVFIGRTDTEAETPILWPSHAKSWLIGKDPDAGRDWGQEEKGMTEDEMSGWTWVWVNSGSWWWTWRPGVLQFMWSQRVGHDWVTELNWTEGATEYKGFCDQVILG